MLLSVRFKNLCISHVGILSWGNLIYTNSYIDFSVNGGSGKNGGKKPGPPVFLAHGLTSSSAQWVFGPPEKSLGLLLADAGNYFWAI